MRATRTAFATFFARHDVAMPVVRRVARNDGGL
jgi:hypothetical protein